MTTDELVEYIADALNLTNVEQKSRILRELNVRYRQATSSVGLVTSRREEFTKNATIGSEYLTFTGTEKLDTVYRKISNNKRIILDEMTEDEILNGVTRDEPPTKYSVFSIAPQSVTIHMNCVPTTTFALYAMGLGDASSLSGTVSPAIPESFHDVLIYGVLADEYMRKEKDSKAADAEQKFQNRLSDLRMFIAKSAYMRIYRGKHSISEGWWDTQEK